jgi:hypothetical protein
MGKCKSQGKDFKRGYAKEQEKTWDRLSLRKETLKNRKEDFKSKILRKDFRSKIVKE